jgi:hypothetical protein
VAGQPALATPRAGDRGLDRGEDIKLPAQAGDAQDPLYRSRRRGQAQEPAGQPGAAPGTHQHGEAAGVGVTHPGQAGDEPAGGRAEQAGELLAQAAARAMLRSPLSAAMA